MAFGVGDVKVGSVEKVIFSQVTKFKTAVQQFARKSLNDAGKKVRFRMIHERLSGIKYERKKAPKGAPLAKKTGRLIRSIFYKPQIQGDKVVLVVGIGSRGVYWADRYEDEGRLQFGRVAKEVLTEAKADLQIGFAFLAKNPGIPAGTLSAESEAVEAPISALQGELAAAWQGRSGWLARNKQERAYNTRFRQLRAIQRGGVEKSGFRAFRKATKGFGAFGL